MARRITMAACFALALLGFLPTLTGCGSSEPVNLEGREGMTEEEIDAEIEQNDQGDGEVLQGGDD